MKPKMGVQLYFVSIGVHKRIPKKRNKKLGTDKNPPMNDGNYIFDTKETK
jgi:hypothetical protein